MVTHLSTNRAGHTLTWLMRRTTLPLRQTTKLQLLTAGRLQSQSTVGRVRVVVLPSDTVTGQLPRSRGRRAAAVAVVVVVVRRSDGGRRSPRQAGRGGREDGGHGTRTARVEALAERAGDDRQRPRLSASAAAAAAADVVRLADVGRRDRRDVRRLTTVDVGHRRRV